MNKVLVTDLQDTLIPYLSDSCALLYGSNTHEYYKKRIYENLKEELLPFFYEGNKLAIVADTTYMDIEELINTDINKIYETFKGFEELIDVYINDTQINAKIKLFNSKTITPIDGKEKVFEYIDTNSEIYSLGNDSEEIEMLRKSISLNGNAALIYHKLLNPRYINNEQHIISLINERVHALVEDELSKKKLSQVAKVQLEKRIWLNYYDKFKQEILNQLQNSTITYIDIIKELYLRKEINYYYHSVVQANPSLETTNNLLENIKVYNSFNEYNTLVLRKKDTLQ